MECPRVAHVPTMDCAWLPVGFCPWVTHGLSANCSGYPYATLDCPLVSHGSAVGCLWDIR